MTDYDTISNIEIDERVAKLRFKKVIVRNGKVYRISSAGTSILFSPCNNPLDTWPLIIENKINIEWIGNEMPDLSGWASANALSDSHEWISHLVNTKVHSPLRAVCIVYLMMMEKIYEN